MKTSSLAFKLALAVSIFGLLQAVGVLMFSYLTMANSLDMQNRHLLQDKMNQALVLLNAEHSIATLGSTAYRLDDLLSGHEDLFIAVAEPKSNIPLVTFSPIAAESLRRLQYDTWAADAFLDWQASDSKKHMLSYAAAGTVKNGQEYVVVMTADRTKDRELLSGLVITSLTAAPFALAIVLLAAMAVVAFSLKPLNRFREIAMRISAKNLSGRIDQDSLPSELKPLGQAFNSMLDRLHESVGRLSQFSSDLAHEMRTPIGILLGRTQVALSQPRSQDELLDLLEGNVEELERLSSLISDMLFLAQADDATASVERLSVDLTTEAKKVADYLSLLSEERNINIMVKGRGQALADRGLIQRAITNLLSNAVRYGRANSTVRVEVENGDNAVCLTVANDGVQIPPDQLDRLFDRFYRIDSARSRDNGGTGLGLAIVKAIMSLHQGTVHAESLPTGETRFTLVFPRG